MNLDKLTEIDNLIGENIYYEIGNNVQIKLIKSNSFTIYNNFVLIRKEYFYDYFKNIIKTDIKNNDISFISINNNDILKINNKKEYRLLNGKLFIRKILF